MTKLQSFMGFTYAQYATQYLKIDEDEQGLFCQVPGMGGDWFKVRVDESGVCPVATHCRCAGFKHHEHCQHTEIVDAFYARIYKTNIEKADAAHIEAAMDAADAQEEAAEMVAIAEQIVARPQIEAPKIVKLNCQQSRQVSFFEGLPSRRKVA